MKVFIENEAGSDKKNIFNEKTLEYRKTVAVSSKVPYPYGFVLNTTSGDGDNLDCFVLTSKELKTRQVVECTTIGLMEQFETSWDPEKPGMWEEDHKVLAVLENENVEIDENIKSQLISFVTTVFNHIPDRKVRVGNFLDKEAAEKLIKKSLN